jgi:hypothetical protein
MARKASPDTVRVVLTGQADLKAAIGAVNEGQVFRFLTKPCPPAQLLPALEAAVEQHKAITSQQGGGHSLKGAVSPLTELLALGNPAAAGRAMRVTRSVAEMAAALQMPDRPSLEAAARLSQVGFLTLPAELAERIHNGETLNDEDAERVLKVPHVAEKILADVPGLDLVKRILAACVRPIKRLAMGADEKSKFMLRASQMLRIAMDYDDLVNKGHAPDKAIALLKARDAFDPEVLEALATAKAAGGGAAEAEDEERELALTAVRPGMIAADDIKMVTGALLVARGHEISAAFVERAKMFRAGTVKEPVRVIVRPAPEAPAVPTKPVPPEVPL